MSFDLNKRILYILSYIYEDRCTVNTMEAMTSLVEEPVENLLDKVLNYRLNQYFNTSSVLIWCDEINILFWNLD